MWRTQDGTLFGTRQEAENANEGTVEKLYLLFPNKADALRELNDHESITTRILPFSPAFD
jgi:hypothetical protein